MPLFLKQSATYFSWTHVYISACRLISIVLVSVGYKFKIYIGKSSEITRNTMDSIWGVSKLYFMPLKFSFMSNIEDNIFEAQT